MVFVGDKKIEVLDKCGAPLSRDIVGVETHFADEWMKKNRRSKNGLTNLIAIIILS
ncbi:DUF2845 domain-containing protein [Thermodesulfobacteriota bacterium]